MSNSQWTRDQEAGALAMREWEEQKQADQGKAKEAEELRSLLSAFIDASVLRGFVVTPEQWERACLLCGRWCPPFVNGSIKPKGGDEG